MTRHEKATTDAMTAALAVIDTKLAAAQVAREQEIARQFAEVRKSEEGLGPVTRKEAMQLYEGNMTSTYAWMPAALAQGRERARGDRRLPVYCSGPPFGKIDVEEFPPRGKPGEDL